MQLHILDYGRAVKIENLSVGTKTHVADLLVQSCTYFARRWFNCTYV